MGCHLIDTISPLSSYEADNKTSAYSKRSISGPEILAMVQDGCMEARKEDSYSRKTATTIT
jgi:hypothetical protein